MRSGRLTEIQATTIMDGHSSCTPSIYADFVFRPGLQTPFEQPGPPYPGDIPSEQSRRYEAEAEENDMDMHTVYLTHDIYSVAILAGAGYCKSTGAKLWIFFLAIICFVAQFGSLILAVLDLQPDDSSLICCTRLLGHPVNVSENVRIGQWLAFGFSIFSLENIICVDTLAFINAIVSLFCYPTYQARPIASRLYEPTFPSNTESSYSYFDIIREIQYANESSNRYSGGNLFAFAAKKAPISFLFLAFLRISVGLLTVTIRHSEPHLSSLARLLSPHLS